MRFLSVMAALCVLTAVSATIWIRTSARISRVTIERNPDLADLSRFGDLSSWKAGLAILDHLSEIHRRAVLDADLRPLRRHRTIATVATGIFGLPLLTFVLMWIESAIGK